MRSTLALALIILALLAWLAARNAAAQVAVTPTPTAAPALTATPVSEKEQLEIVKLKAELDPLSNLIERFILPTLPVVLASIAAVGAWFRWNQDRQKYKEDREADAQRLNQDKDKYKEDREADAQRRDEEQFRFIVEQFSGGEAARLAAAVNIQTFFAEARLSRFRRQAVEILIGNLRVEQTEPVRKALMVALREGIFSLPPDGERLDLRGCNLKEAEWGPKKVGNEEIGIPLQGANLQGAILDGAILWGANLQGAILIEANLQGANFWDAQLQGAQLNGAILRGADLGGANLQGAMLWGANLQGAMLEGANLQRAGLGGAVFGSFFIARVEQQTDFSEAILDDRCIASLKDTNWPDAHWDDDVRKRLEELYGAPSEGATKPEAATETPGEHEA